MVFTVVSFVICSLRTDTHRDLNLITAVSHHLCKPSYFLRFLYRYLYMWHIYIFIYISKKKKNPLALNITFLFKSKQNTTTNKTKDDTLSGVWMQTGEGSPGPGFRGNK